MDQRTLLQTIFDTMIAGERYVLIFKGLGITLLIAICAILIGTILGCIFALMKISDNKIAKAFANLYTTILRGIPLATQLMIFYFVIFRSLGLSKWQTLFKIVLPQAVKAVLPTYTSEFIVLIKETSVASFIAVMDLTKAGDMIRNSTYNAWIPLLTCAVIYLILTVGLTEIFGIVEKRLARSDRS